MTNEEIYARLTEIFRELFADDALVLTPQTSANDIEGWDSFVHLSLIVAVESRFGIKFSTAEIESLTNVGTLVGRIDAHLR
jgi:acyl carrier protein